MKVLLIQPPVEDFYQTSLRTMPTGLLYLAAALRQNGYEVEILDCQATEKKSVIDIPPEFAYLKRYYHPGNLSPFKLFSHYRHYGIPWDEIRERIRTANADVIGVSSLFTPFYREAFRIATIAKELNPATPIILGGAHVNACPEKVLSHPHVDFIMLGECERTLPELIAALADGHGTLESICGLGYKSNGKLRLPCHGDLLEDLDALPLPARDLIDPERYRLAGKRLTMLITSRGCPYRCTFCSIFLTAGRQFRTRSISGIIDEMRHCRERYGIEIFDIEDDNFSFDQTRAAEILAGIREEFGEEQIEMLAMNGISAANISERLVVDMKRTGFRALNLALVTSDRQQQRAAKRPGSTSHFDRVVKKGAEAGIEMVNYLILGLPESTVEEMIGSIIFLMERPVLIGPSVFYATPGTESYDQCVERGLLKSTELALQRSTCFPVETPQFSRNDLVTLFRICRLLNFIKSRLDAQAEGEIEFSLHDILKTNSILDIVGDDGLPLGPLGQGLLSEPLHQGELYSFGRKLTENEIGCWLAQAFWEEGVFLGMKVARRETDRVLYRVFREEYSAAVSQSFLEQAQGHMIVGVKNPKAMTRVSVAQASCLPHMQTGSMSYSTRM